MEFEYFSSSRSDHIHDVFINFRGEDTRMNFVSHLYAALSNAGLNTFLDETDFPKGMDLRVGLLETIARSLVCIVVFSRNYTESSWCLDELEAIIDCHKFHGHIVLPIFYHVVPSQVRHQTGDFGNVLKAFAQKRSWDEYMMSRWNTALTAATNFSGWDVSNTR